MTEPTRIIAIRHGETAWNVDARIQGQLDIPLNETGRWQARRVAGAVAGEAVAAVYASDLARARETARHVADAAGLDVVEHEGLRERGFHRRDVVFGLRQGQAHGLVPERRELAGGAGRRGLGAEDEDAHGSAPACEEVRSGLGADRFAGLFAEPHLRAREMLVAVEHPGSSRPAVLPGSPIKYTETPTGIYRRPPRLGEHNAEVLAELDAPETP